MVTVPRANDLPDFESPPVVETGLSVQFQQLRQLRVTHFGLFWHEIKNRYPRTEEHPALEAVVEVSRALKRRLECSSSSPEFAAARVVCDENLHD